MIDIDDNAPFMDNNYFSQEWKPGTLATSKFPDKPFFIDEKRNPTNDNEDKFANTLQNYYLYKQIKNEAEEGSIMKLTSFYIPNPELFKILEVFKPLDQGHDFYTSSRNVEGNWTKPLNFKFDKNKNIPINNYNQFQANTSFGGGYNIFGLICIDEDSYNFLKKKDDVSLDINNLLNNIVNQEKKINLYDNLKCKYGVKINFNLNQDNKLQVNEITNNQEHKENEMGDILFLSLYTTDIYNNGMHSLWNFIKPTYVYAVQILDESSETNLKFNAYFLYKCNNIVDNIYVNIEKIIDNYVNNDINLKGKKGNPLFIGLKNKLSDTNKLKIDIDNIITDKNNTNYIDFEWNRGQTLVFTNFKTDNVIQSFYPKEIKDFLIVYLLKKYYSNLSPSITDKYTSLIKTKQQKIIDYKLTEIQNNIYKIPVSVIDANPSPKESSLVASLRNLDNEIKLSEYPYKYSIVSINVDGSGLGGQISKSYHPPELSIYMTIFDVNNKFHGFIYRICFLKKVNSNSLNDKSEIDVDMYYCFFNIYDIDELQITEELDGTKLDIIQEISAKLNDYILDNTKLDKDNVLITEIINSEDKTIKTKPWYKFTLISDAPSVLNINKIVKDMDKYVKMNRDKIQIEQKSTDINKTMLSNFSNITNLVSSIASNIYNSIALNAESKDPNSINNIISTAIKIYLNDQRFKEIYPEINDFVKIFLIRNKYIGDNSRATDTLYYNKEAIMEPIQISNDENTLSTAKLVNVSSILASPGSSERHIYAAPYITNKNQYITSKTTQQNEDSKLNELLNEQESSISSTGVKRKKQVIDFIPTEQRSLRSRNRGGSVDISQPLPLNIINRAKLIDKEMKSTLIDKQLQPSQPLSTQETTETLPSLPIPSEPSEPSEPSSTISSSTPSTVSTTESITIGPSTQDQSLNNLKKYLNNIRESIQYINTTYTNEYVNQHINDFIIKLYLQNIKENIGYFSNGLTLDILLNILKNYASNSNATLNEGLYIKNTYNSIFKNFDKIQSLISSAIDIEENVDISETLDNIQNENIQQGGTISKVTFESINDKMNNLFDFTQNRIDVLNECYENNENYQNTKDIINYYNDIIVKLYTYLSGYYESIYSLNKIDNSGMCSFIGVYCFFMYFTIEFNSKLEQHISSTSEESNLTYESNNKIKQFFLGNQLLDWINNFLQADNENLEDQMDIQYNEIEMSQDETTLFGPNEINKYYEKINVNMRLLPYSQYIQKTPDINSILISLDEKIGNNIFKKDIYDRTRPLQFITAIKSLYFLLDDNFIEDYINKSDINTTDMSSEKFLEILYNNILYGLLDNKKLNVNNKYKNYIENQELLNNVKDLLYFKNQQSLNTGNKTETTNSNSGGTKRNKIINKKNKKTINKKIKKNKKKTIKKKGKKIRRNTIKK